MKVEVQIRSNEEGMGQKGGGMKEEKCQTRGKEERERGTKQGEIQIRGGLLV